MLLGHVAHVSVLCLCRVSAWRLEKKSKGIDVPGFGRGDEKSGTNRHPLASLSNFLRLRVISAHGAFMPTRVGFFVQIHQWNVA